MRAPCFSSPKDNVDYCTHVPVSTTRNNMIDDVMPSPSSFADNFACVVTNVNVCQTVSGNTTAVSVLGARPTAATSGGSQQTLSGSYSVACPPAATADALFSTTVSTSDRTRMGQVPTPAVSMVPTHTRSLGLLSTPSMSNSTISTTLIAPPQGQVVSTAAETGRLPISSGAGVASNVTSVALSLPAGNVASTVSSLPTANVVSSSSSSVLLVVVNTPSC